MGVRVVRDTQILLTDLFGEKVRKFGYFSYLSPPGRARIIPRPHRDVPGHVSDVPDHRWPDRVRLSSENHRFSSQIGRFWQQIPIVNYTGNWGTPKCPEFENIDPDISSLKPLFKNRLLQFLIAYPHVPASEYEALTPLGCEDYRLCIFELENFPKMTIL